ncbi:Centromere protein V like [Verticillium longisporum]|uniref:Centromere protein V like n=1 Tax=Verticillium longisporum TaxID=100787 RepID=A0A8I2ZFT6_VERLO|nr:Centromere protein V like [Verticillium longisporum]
MADLTTYRGNCHCGAFVFEVDLPVLTSVTECNCSICRRKGYIGDFPISRDVFRIVKGNEDDLAVYEFGAKKYQHKFCATCGTAVIMSVKSDASIMALNVHVLQGVDTWVLEKKRFDGASSGPKPAPRTYDGPPPEMVDGGKLYTGSCHCGAVQVALASKPLDESFPDGIGECNCSICERNAYIWAWPMREQVVLFGDEKNISRYEFGKKNMGKMFCRICSVHMTNFAAEKSEEELAAMSGEERAYFEGGKARHPVNLRVIDGLDLDALRGKITRIKGAEAPPAYVNP